MSARNDLLANIQVQRDEVRYFGQVPEYSYSLGWGKDSTLQGDSLTYDELKALHALIGQVLEEDKPKQIGDYE